MASFARRTNQNNYTWPGFVDILASLLMVVMFLLLVFVLAQFFMGQALTGRDQALTKLKSQIVELADLLSLERKENKDIRANLSQLSEELQVSMNFQDNLKTTVSDLRVRFNSATETINILQKQAIAMRQNNSELVDKVAMLQEQNKENLDKNEELRIINQNFEMELIDAKKNALIKTKEIGSLINDIRLLNILKGKLESDISDLTRSLENKDEEILSKKDVIDRTKATIIEEKKLTKNALAEVALLNFQMLALRKQLSNIQIALDKSEKETQNQKAQISALGKRLNIALASKVHELSKYRSEFFGRLRLLLGDRQNIRIVGDRFVFQSEVLFAKAEAQLGLIGENRLKQLAKTLIDVSQEIPAEIDWVLRIDGHTDKDPIQTAQYPSNWELSSARAISVLKFLIQTGLPAKRLVAAGFGEHHPLDASSDEIAKRRNRRIEIKLTRR